METRFITTTAITAGTSLSLPGLINMEISDLYCAGSLKRNVSPADYTLNSLTGCLTFYFTVAVDVEIKIEYFPIMAKQSFYKNFCSLLLVLFCSLGLIAQVPVTTGNPQPGNWRFYNGTTFFDRTSYVYSRAPVRLDSTLVLNSLPLMNSDTLDGQFHFVAIDEHHGETEKSLFKLSDPCPAINTCINSLAWTLNGNSNLNDTFNFFGTIDASNIRFRLGNQPSGFLEQNGFNIALGTGSMANLVSGILNTAYGTGSLQNISTGNYNTGVGSSAGSQLSTQTGNTIIGNDAMRVAIGANNTSLGFGAGYAFIGNRNVIIGSDADADTCTRCTIVGANSYGQGLNNTLIGSQVTQNAKYHGSIGLGIGTTITANNQFNIGDSIKIAYMPLNTGIAGSILTNDGAGNANWATNAATSSGNYGWIQLADGTGRFRSDSSIHFERTGPGGSTVTFTVFDSVNNFGKISTGQVEIKTNLAKNVFTTNSGQSVDISYQLPTASVAGSLVNDGSNNLSWQSADTRVYILPAYANDAAAGVGGLSTGKLYQTGLVGGISFVAIKQ